MSRLVGDNVRAVERLEEVGLVPQQHHEARPLLGEVEVAAPFWNGICKYLVYFNGFQQILGLSYYHIVCEEKTH